MLTLYDLLTRAGDRLQITVARDVLFVRERTSGTMPDVDRDTLIGLKDIEVHGRVVDDCIVELESVSRAAVVNARLKFQSAEEIENSVLRLCPEVEAWIIKQEIDQR